MIIYQVANTISNDCDNCLITTQRKQYITLGYEPIPCRGKIPVSKSWQNICIDFDAIAFWSVNIPTHSIPVFARGILPPLILMSTTARWSRKYAKNY